MDLNLRIKNISIGEPSFFRGLSMFPIQSESVDPPGYLTLAEALSAGAVSVLEKSTGGVVSEVKIANHGAEKVLILEGEEIMGAKQNRTVNLTILLKEMSERAVPVTCVEAGRWAYQTQEFHVSGECHFAKARRKKQMSVTYSMRSHGERAADQSEVWNDIQEKMFSMKVSSPTSAMREVFETHADDLQAFVEAMPAVEGQAGAVFAIGPRLVGLDLFDSAPTWRKMHARLLRSYAIDAIEEEQKDGRPTFTGSLSEVLLRDLSACEQTSHDALGLGSDIRFTSPRLHGAALAWDERLIHLSAFWEEERSNPGYEENSRISRPSRRRNLRRG